MLATVSDKGQITLPKKLREQMGALPGVRLELKLRPDGTLLVRALPRGSQALFGMLAWPGEASRALAEMDAGVTAHVQQRSRRRV